MTLATNCRRGPVHRFEREMNQLLSTFFPGSARSCLAGARRDVPARNVPAVNAWEDDEAVHIELEAPGVKPEQVDVSVHGEELSIKIDRPAIEREGVTYHRRERGSGPFARVLRLPVEIDAEGVEANLVHGVLTVRLPKVAAEGPRKIQVSTSGLS